MTSFLSLMRSLPMRCDSAVPLLRTQLEILEEASEHANIVLAASIPGAGRMAVPVRIRLTHGAPKSGRFGLTIAALEAPWLYPRFRGELETIEAGAAVTVLKLSGDYQVPFGLLGRVFDPAAARGIAPRGLEDLLERLVADIIADATRHADAVISHRASWE